VAESDADLLDPNADPLTVAGILSAVRGDPNALAAARVRGNPKLQRLDYPDGMPPHDWRADAGVWSKILQNPNSSARYAAQALTGTGGYTPGSTPNEDVGLPEIPPLAVQPRAGQLPQGPDPNRPAAEPVATPERFRTWPEKTLVSGATMAGDVAAGKYGSGLTEESVASMIPRTQDIVALAGAPVPAEVGAAGVFGGKLSRTADLPKLGKASKMEAVGAPPEDIWNETGWFRGADRQWKYEIPDTGATAINRGVRDEGNLLNPEYMGPLSDFLNHPELYEAYPSTRSIPTNITINPEEGTSGFHWRATGDRPSRLGLQTPIEWGDPNVGGMDPAIFHELDHVLQQREGFARGSNPEAELGRVAGRPVPPELAGRGMTPERWQAELANELYRRQAGEVSARNAENRYGLAMLGRPEATSLPNLTEDVPRNKQTVTFKSDTQDPAAVIAALAKTPGHEFFNIAKFEAEGQGAQSGQLGRGEGGPGGIGGVEEAQRAATEAAGSRQPLEGLPSKPLKIGDSHYVPGPSEKIHQVADDYMRGAGLPYSPPKQYIDTRLFEGGGKPGAVIAALKKGKPVEAPNVIPSQPSYVTEEGLAVPGRQFALAQTAAKKEIKQGPKGAGPLDLSSQAEIPNVPQSELERYNPKHGVSDRLQDALKNEQVRQGVADSIDEGVKIGADKWYHTEPVRRAFADVYGKGEGQDRYSNFATFMDMVAATSPRSDVSTNIRNASYYFQHALQGKELPEKLPYPYGHVAQNLHRQNFETLTDPGSPGWDVFKNPKPPSFSQNLQGNLTPGTMDTHAFRNIGMRTQDPRFLETSISNKYKPGKDPVEDSLAKRFGDTTKEGTVVFRPQQLFNEGKLTMDEALKIPTFWASKPKANEYGAAEKFYRELGEEKGLKTAEAQSAAWSGAGGLTGLGTPPTHTFPELFNEQVLFTAMIRRENPRDTLINAITGKKPLLSNTAIPGGAVAAGQALNNYVPPKGPAPGVSPWKQ
jgi:Large polyvalent protein associated domain 23